MLLVACAIVALCADGTAGVKEKSKRSINEVRKIRTLLRICRVPMERLLVNATKPMPSGARLRGYC